MAQARRVLSTLVCASLLTAPAMAGPPLIPPSRYDVPFTGAYHEFIVPRKDIDAYCGFDVLAACAIARGSECIVYLSEGGGLTLAALRRHERAHCSGWPPDHPL